MPGCRKPAKQSTQIVRDIDRLMMRSQILVQLGLSALIDWLA
jgi:hypothetical protein